MWTIRLYPSRFVTVHGQKWRNQHKNEGSRQYKPIFRAFFAPTASNIRLFPFIYNVFGP